MPENIPSFFLDSAQKNRAAIAFRYFETSWKKVSYGEFLSLAKALAADLAESGVVPGDRIAIVSENRPEWCAAYMSILFCRGIAVPVDMQLGPVEIRNILSDAEVKVVFYSSKTGANVSKAIEGGPFHSIEFDTVSVRHPGRESFEIAVDAAPDDVASIIYTSGTTGNPKGVILTHRNFCSDAAALIQAGIVSGSDNVLSILPMHHTYPFMCTFIVPVLLGASITFGPGLKAAELISAITEGGVTVVLGVPRLFEMIRNGIVSKMKEKRFLSSLLMRVMRVCSAVRRSVDVNLGKIIFRTVHQNFGLVRFFASGGARLDPAVMEDLEALGFTVLEGYGLTETAPVITFNPLAKRKPGSAGKALPGAELKIDGGEIAVRGAMVMSGYYKNNEATAEVIRDGWFYTGDLGYINAEGYLFITGRRKEVIVLSSGKNIYPEDVERAYLQIPLIKEIGITGIEKNGIVEAIQAIIVPDLDYARHHNIGNIAESLKWELNDVTAGLPEYMRIRGTMLYQEPLPRTPLGKLRRFMLRDIVDGAAAKKDERTGDKALLGDEIGYKVVSCINAVMEEKIPIRSDDNLELDLGFDSLKRIEFISSIEEVFSVSLPETFISDAQTVGDVVTMLKEYAEGKSGAHAGPVTWKDILEKEPPEEDRLKAAFSHGPAEKVIIYLMVMAMKLFFRLFSRLSIAGKDNLPERGPYVLAVNHASYLDGFIIAAAIAFSTFENVRFLGISTFFTGRIKGVLARMSHVIPIDAETYLNRALQMSSYVLDQGKSLCIFPEGGRSFGEEVLPFKKGVGIIGLERKIPVVPVYIEGSSKALPRGAALIRPARIRVFFGKPFSINDIDMKSKPAIIDEYQFFADQLRERVLSLLRK